MAQASSGVALRSSFDYAAIQVAAKAVAATTLLLVARQAPPEVTGRLVLAVVAASFLALLVEFGRGKTAQRAAALGRSWRQVLGVQPHILSAVGLLAAAIATLRSAGSAQVVILVASFGCLLAFGSMAENCLLGLGSGAAAASGNLLFNLVTLGLAQRELLSGDVSEGGLMLSYVVGAAAAAAFYEATLYVRLRSGLLSGRDGREQLDDVALVLERRISRLAGMQGLLALLYFRADVLVLGLIADSREVAVYGTAYRFLEVAIAIIQLAAASRMRQVVRAEGACGDRESVARDTLVGMLGLSIVLAVGLNMITPAIPWLLGEAYRGGVGLVLIFSGSLIGFSLQSVAALYSTASTRLAAEWHWLLFLAASNVLLALSASPLGYYLAGITGVATAQASADVALGAFSVGIVFARLNLTRPASVVVAGAVALIALTGAYVTGNAVVTLVPLIMGGLVVLFPQRVTLRRVICSW